MLSAEYVCTCNEVYMHDVFDVAMIACVFH